MGVGDKNKTSQKFQKSYFDVLGLCCSSEVPLIEKLLKPLDGVKDVSIIVPSRTVIVLHDNLIISQVQIVKRLNEARLEANVSVFGDGGNYRKKWPSPYAIGCGVLLLLSFLKYVYRPLEWLALGAVAVGICPIFLKGIAALRNFTLDTNILALVAVMGSVALHDYWEAGAIVFLFTIAQWLESRASHKATAVMSSLMNIVPQKAVLAETGEEVDAEEVKVGSILAVKAGETIAVDGIVVGGSCEVDEKALTGESFPVSKQTGSTVWAGTINLNGYISFRTSALAEDCVVAKMAKLVEEAQNNKSKTQRFIDKCAKFYTPAVVVVSACLAAIPAVLRVDNQNRWFHLALVVLVSACPCALILSTPVATFCAISKAAAAGVLIKGGEYLETMAKIKIMAFDKTGTITRAEFVVTRFQSLSEEFSLNTLLYWVSSIESKSSHPMAAALIDYGRSHSIEPKSEKVEEFENFPGEGIHGKIDGKDVYVGNTKIALRAGCATVPRLEGDSNDGKSKGYVFLGAALAGFFTLSDACRTGVNEAIKELKSMGIKTAMLTGDSHEAAALAQDQVLCTFNVVHAELLPQDKARIIKDFQEEAPTAMVGDGLNDAPALATADIGISMGISGSALATETGHVILMSNDIRKISKVIQLAKRAHRKVIQNVFLSILTKTAVLALAAAGYPLVWAAVLADVGTCLAVILNSMLLLRENKRPITKCCESSTKRVRGCQSGTFSLGSCHNQKRSNTTETNGCCAHEDRIKETKHLDDHCMGSNEEHMHCNSGPSIPISCVKKHCTKFDGCHNICASSDGAKQFDHNVAKIGCQGTNHDTLFIDNCSDSCHNRKSSNADGINGYRAHENQIKDAKHSDDRSMGSNDVHNDGNSGISIPISCVKKHYTKFDECHDICASGDGTKQFDHSVAKTGCHDTNHETLFIDNCSGSCHSRKSSNAAGINSYRAHEDQIKDAKHSDDRSMGSNDVHNHGNLGPSIPSSCVEKQCKKFVGFHSICVAGDGLDGEKQFDKSVIETGCQGTNHEALFIDNCSLLHATGVGSSRSNGVGCEGTKACVNLDGRQIGGCCKSLRKECCGNSGHFGDAFRGGLSEIVID